MELSVICKKRLMRLCMVHLYLFQLLSSELAEQISVQWMSLTLMRYLFIHRNTRSRCRLISFSLFPSENFLTTQCSSQKKLLKKYQVKCSTSLGKMEFVPIQRLKHKREHCSRNLPNKDQWVVKCKRIKEISSVKRKRNT